MPMDMRSFFGLWLSSLGVLSACGDDGGGSPPDAAGEDGPPQVVDGPPGVAPAAQVVFPATGAILPHGDAYPIVIAGSHDDGLDRLDVVIDGVVIAGGPGVPALWRSAMTGAGAGAISEQQIVSSGWFEFVVPARLTQKVIGLGDIDTGAVVGDIDVGFYFTPISFNLVGGGGGIRTYASGDVFRLDLSTTTIEWRHNGVVIATAPRGTATMHVETWLPGPGAAITSALIAASTGPAEPVSWLSHIDTTAGHAFATTWNTMVRADGDATIVARATASSGTTGDSSPVVVSVDNTAPTCNLVAPLAGTVSGTITLDGEGDDVHLALIAFFVDGGLHSQHDGQSQATSQWNTSAVANGLHVVEVRAYDNANHSIACPVQVTVAN
jgi:hypothetical protein